jgi:hypothetical protein
MISSFSKRLLVPALAIVFATAGCAHPGVPEYSVEKQAAMAPGNPPPRYPAEHIGTGDSALVRVQVVIDTTGYADMTTVRVLGSPPPAFARAVIAALPTYRFYPAEVGGGLPSRCNTRPDGVRECSGGRPGKKVRQLLEIPFRFQPPAA